MNISILRSTEDQSAGNQMSGESIIEKKKNK